MDHTRHPTHNKLVCVRLGLLVCGVWVCVATRKLGSDAHICVRADVQKWRLIKSRGTSDRIGGVCAQMQMHTGHTVNVASDEIKSGASDQMHMCTLPHWVV